MSVDPLIKGFSHKFTTGWYSVDSQTRTVKICQSPRSSSGWSAITGANTFPVIMTHLEPNNPSASPELANIWGHLGCCPMVLQVLHQKWMWYYGYVVVCVRSCVPNKTVSLSYAYILHPDASSYTAKSVRHHEDLRNQQQKNIEESQAVAHVKLLKHPLFFGAVDSPSWKWVFPAMCTKKSVSSSEASTSVKLRGPSIIEIHACADLNICTIFWCGKNTEKHHPIGIAHRTLDWRIGLRENHGKSENLQEKPIFHGENRWFPVDFPEKNYPVNRTSSRRAPSSSLALSAAVGGGSNLKIGSKSISSHLMILRWKANSHINEIIYIYIIYIMCIYNI